MSTILVLFMVVPGLAMFYGGLVRSKNILSLMSQVLVTFALVTILWFAYGYSLAFSGGNAIFGDLSKLSCLASLTCLPTPMRWQALFPN
ncbi:ammonium transporter [Advenella kashmirensis WT001]|uniref:Ammonium transporter n=1 Tax=Advenella kashmirensis (strain DSM 17095 / LMG 22695 / WT001) TaxID=1036672 RepID=I3UCE3_ADVKW|nr:ammonium transporter [Advenella kashmirensis WT001]